MGSLGRFLAQPRRQQLLHLEAVVLNASFRVLALIAPFSVSRWVAWRLARTVSKEEPGMAIRAVHTAGRRVPGSNCLSEALTAWVLLTRAGSAPALRIGVVNAERFQAHAWVECNGEVVVGGDPISELQPLVGGDVMAVTSSRPGRPT